ncbi:GntR family transcriptional regulator [Kutzneria kofuensis]|uniref:DNA-binding GntR family transcriptional regulator n=1 Tax=Kutzneria kofuensis TaxID=103725 RepID=A0A7W9KN42_9PSEU|nr:GntR family transcriptional regulator [Kutzneria kofuensis]MBB5895621.1 DNA-binding GntR family transcriptional regulator [Kutzneria kofuensis]
MSVSGRDRAYDYLRNTVLADPAAQGTFLNEQDIADRIGVSRTPIREALLMLSAEELVRLVPKRGAYIPELTAGELRELIELRGVLERFAAERVLATGTAPIEELLAALADQRGKDDRTFIEADTRFHTILVRAAGNEMLARTYETLRARQVVSGLVALRGGSAGRREAVLTEHEAIVAALAAGDPGPAREAITAHLDATLRAQLAIR